jgi:hypothetical protein
LFYGVISQVMPVGPIFADVKVRARGGLLPTSPVEFTDDCELSLDSIQGAGSHF